MKWGAKFCYERSSRPGASVHGFVKDSGGQTSHSDARLGGRTIDPEGT